VVATSFRRVPRIPAAEIECSGLVPRDGLLVSNHLSYLDILLCHHAHAGSVRFQK
jgi:hypothetical protein